LELGTLVFEHPDFILVNKPAGVSVHKDNAPEGFIGALTHARSEPLWLVHRLDKLTSGLLLLARNQVAAAELSQAFAQRQVDKLYLAVSAHKPKRKQGMISGDMEQARRGNWKLSRTQSNPARTEFVSRNLAPGYTLLVCHPLTGKTHQIRVALKSEAAPILGDNRYAGQGDTDTDRGYLHAWQLGFNYQGETFCFRADPTEGDWFIYAVEQGALDASKGGLQFPEHWKLPWLSSTQGQYHGVENE